MLLNCGVGEDSWESFGLQGDPTHLMEIIIVVSLEGMMLKLKLQYFGHLMWRVDSLEKLWCWEGLGAGERDDRGWDGWMASPTQWTWVCADSRRWWRTGKPSVLWSTGMQSQTRLTDWAKPNFTRVNHFCPVHHCIFIVNVVLGSGHRGGPLIFVDWPSGCLIRLTSEL